VGHYLISSCAPPRNKSWRRHWVWGAGDGAPGQPSPSEAKGVFAFYLDVRRKWQNCTVVLYFAKSEMNEELIKFRKLSRIGCSIFRIFSITA